MNMESSDALEAFIQLYQKLDKNNLDKLADIYSENIIFEDPAHRIEGYPSLFSYFQNLYQNVNQCNFLIEHFIKENQEAVIFWKMVLSHPKLSRGKHRTVHGCSRLTFHENKVIFQRDYFDLGEMLYEGLPIIGRLINAIKQRLGK